MSSGFDYIVAGAGTAGCVLAARLSADPAVRVLLVEAGGWARGWKTDMPAALAYPMQDARLNWGYRTEPQAHLDGRSLHWPRGRAVGGSSVINGMVYVRGHPLDYERWVREGAVGWGWADVLPYFRRSQAHLAGPDPYRGGDGPLAVCTGELRNPLYRAWIEAGRQAGYAASDDLNGFRQEGFGPLDMTVRRGVRCSAATAYLEPARRRPNLTVLTDALVLRVNFRGTEAVGVSVAVGGEVRDIAAGEVVLCGGAIASPQLLQLSGVGDPDLLGPLGIDVVSPLPGVGRNLQDHLCIYVQHACRTDDSLARVLRQPAKTAVGLRWLLTRGGLGASNQFEAGAFIRSGAGIEHPDLQYHFMPLAVGYEHAGRALAPSYQVDADALRPESRGTVRVRSRDPRQAPAIDPDYLATDHDRRVLRDAVALTREIFARPAFDRFRGPELAPGNHVTSAAAIDAYVRATAESAYHPSCTCAMGTGADAVVDPHCRVYGVDGLRVVDASIMPSVVSGNLNAPTAMIAERAADLILGRDPAAAPPAPYHVAADWQEAQR